MEILTIVNYMIFAIVFSLLILEVGAALVSLVAYERYKERLVAYIAPIWEITGTFSVFYLISLEAIYPKLVMAIGTIYLIPLLIAALFLLTRDSFLAYSEYIGDLTSEKTFARVYAVSTLFMIFLVISILGSGVSGFGINISALSINIYDLLFNTFNILLFLSIFLLVSFAAIVFFNVRRPNLMLLTIMFSVFILTYIIGVYVPYIFLNLANNIYIILPALLVLVTIIILYTKNYEHTKFVVLPWLVLCVFTFELLEYPFLFGGTTNLNYYITSSANTPYLLIITIVGGLFLAISLGYFVYIHHFHKHRSFKKKKY